MPVSTFDTPPQAHPTRLKHFFLAGQVNRFVITNYYTPNDLKIMPVSTFDTHPQAHPDTIHHESNDLIDVFISSDK